MATMDIGQYQAPRPKVGYVDGGVTILECSSCQKPLVRIWVTRPNPKEKQTFLARCCFCGDRSLAQEITGHVHLAGMVSPRKNDVEEDIPLTRIANFTEDGDRVVIHTVRA